MKKPPTAIFTTGDYQALGVRKAAYEMDIKIPECLALAGFNNIDYARMSSPSLTTVDVPKRELGEMAIRSVFDRLDGKEPVEHVFKPELIIREST